MVAAALWTSNGLIAQTVSRGSDGTLAQHVAPPNGSSETPNCTINTDASATRIALSTASERCRRGAEHAALWFAVGVGTRVGHASHNRINVH